MTASQYSQAHFKKIHFEQCLLTRSDKLLHAMSANMFLLLTLKRMQKPYSSLTLVDKVTLPELGAHYCTFEIERFLIGLIPKPTEVTRFLHFTSVGFGSA